MKRRMVTMCERCPARVGLQCHHRLYRDSWYDTRMEDLEALCRDCHRNEHDPKTPEREEFEAIFWHCQEMRELVHERLWQGKPLLRKQRKRLRHIAEMFRNNGGVMLQFSRAMGFHETLLPSLRHGLKGYDAVEHALRKVAA